MKYSKFYDSQVKESPQIFTHKQKRYTFPIDLEYENRGKSKHLIINRFIRSENLVWGSDEIHFISRQNFGDSEYDDSFTLSEFLALIDRHNDYAKKHPVNQWGGDRELIGGCMDKINEVKK